MNRYFNAAEQCNNDTYVVDYSELTMQERGVEIMHEVPNDIHAFHLSNPNHHPYWAINLEKNPALFRGEANCECMFTSIRNDHGTKKWALFVELKYCKEKNIRDNSEYAIHQLTNTQRIIRDHGYIDEHYKIFLNISIPDHSHKEPFTSFIWTPDYIKQMQNQWGFIILGYNQVIILTPTNIKLPREEI